VRIHLRVQMIVRRNMILRRKFFIWSLCFLLVADLADQSRTSFAEAMSPVSSRNRGQLRAASLGISRKSALSLGVVVLLHAQHYLYLSSVT